MTLLSICCLSCPLLSVCLACGSSWRYFRQNQGLCGSLTVLIQPSFCLGRQGCEVTWVRFGWEVPELSLGQRSSSSQQTILFFKLSFLRTPVFPTGFSLYSACIPYRIQSFPIWVTCGDSNCAGNVPRTLQNEDWRLGTGSCHHTLSTISRSKA